MPSSAYEKHPSLKNEVLFAESWPYNHYVWCGKHNSRKFSITLVFMCVRIHSEKRILALSCLSIPLSVVCLSTCISTAPTGWIFVLFDIGHFYENLSRNSVEKIQIWLKSDCYIGHFTWRPKYVHIADSSTYRLFCSSTGVLREPILAFPWQHSMVLYYWQLRVGLTTIQRERIVAFFSNNGYVNAPQCYVIRTLPVFFKFQSFF
jgi:hypothetical protein